ncbi:MAG: NAD(P)/FAD-dependent oxidoreductase [Planctomycetes bacterium]|nr:NAD(P)/FAD-dependent oxidoreductase [Planctomycetota bacterium]
MAYDAIIIGAGMSGLAAGIRLAMYDKKVLILERHYVAGGLNSYYHKFKRPFDVGLHAMTNFVPKGTKRAPLTKLLRQLRIPYDSLQLCEQHGSQIHFPSAQLDFDNDTETLRAEVRRAFPDQIDGFDALTKRVLAYDDTSLDTQPIPSRVILEEHLSNPLLIEMLFCPLMYYGSPNENEMEFGQFCIMWKSVFSEGFARPEGGVRTIIDLLVKKFKELGGELRYSQGVAKILTKEGKAWGVELECERGLTKISTKPRPRSEHAEVIEAAQILSTAGVPETWAMTDGLSTEEPKEAGALTFMESIACLDIEPRELGADKTIVFFNRQETFDYVRAEDYADLRSGVICATNNYDHATPLPEGVLRVTSIASWDKWSAVAKPEPYGELKEKWYQGQLDAMEAVIPTLRERGMRDHITVHDVFTPTTIFHFTRHQRGAIYGAPEKLKSGITPIAGLFIAGTDQGFLGIVGAMLSGISIANAYFLRAGA